VLTIGPTLGDLARITQSGERSGLLAALVYLRRFSRARPQRPAPASSVAGWGISFSESGGSLKQLQDPCLGRYRAGCLPGPDILKRFESKAEPLTLNESDRRSVSLNVISLQVQQHLAESATSCAAAQAETHLL
jgi:hypothetical protein